MLFVFRYIRDYKFLVILSIVLATVNQVFSLMDPQVFSRLIDNYLTKYSELSASEFLQGTLMGVGMFILVAMISRIAKNFQDYFVNVITQKVGMKIYQETIEHVFSLPYKIFEDQQSGQLLQKLIKAKDSLQNYISSLINIAFFSLIGVIFVLSYSFYVDWRVGALYCFLLPVVGFTTTMISRKIKEAQDKISRQSAQVAGSITESIRNVSLIKMLGLVGQEMSRLSIVNQEILNLELDKVKKIRSIEFLQGTTINAMRVALVGFLARLVYQREITVGELMSLYFYSFFIFGQLSMLSMVVRNYQEAKANHEILEEIKTLQPEPNYSDLQKVGHIKEIKFDDVSFGYNEKNVLKNVSFSFEKGTSIAFVGPSGSGKSTILKLIAGLYSGFQGKILFNSIDVDKINLTDYRKKLGIVSQEAQLFSGTIAENLRFVSPDITDQEIMDVMVDVSLDAFVKELADGINTFVGEGGIKLSGGQKQRLAIARALLRKPGILIFDEATSSLDSLVEKEITETINKISLKKPDLMTILVAHRLSTVKNVDKIYVLEQGEIVEEGDHGDLLNKKGLYFAMAREQGIIS